MNTVYILMRDSITLPSQKYNVMLSDIADIYGDCPDIDLGGINKKRIISAIDILDKLGDKAKDAVFLGESKTLVKKAEIKRGGAIRMAIIAISLLIGGIAGILNFHSDVDMRDAHSSVYYLVTGQESEETPVVSIPYSIGIGAGVIVFFGLLSKKAGVAEVELYEYNKQMDEYDRDALDA
ncbi:MAG: hypothetical protein ACOYJD_04715 [Christensenellales bacterium]|jgi:stage V sporulation protein AA